MCNLKICIRERNPPLSHRCCKEELIIVDGDSLGVVYIVGTIMEILISDCIGNLCDGRTVVAEDFCLTILIPSLKKQRVIANSETTGRIACSIGANILK